jgi:hypothetical protein
MLHGRYPIECPLGLMRKKWCKPVQKMEWPCLWVFQFLKCPMQFYAKIGNAPHNIPKTYQATNYSHKDEHSQNVGQMKTTSVSR